MEAKHTPGIRIGREYTIDDAVDIRAKGPAFEVVSGGEGAWSKIVALIAGPSREEAKANADLFAAAPDLLEACARLLSEITTDDARRYHCQRYGESHWMQSVDAARAAIAKAKGESQ